MNGQLGTFIWGVSGSAGIELATMYAAFHSPPFALPERYHKVSFWCVRILLALVAGGLAVAHGIENKPLLALHIGVATPIILHGMARGLRGASGEALTSGGPEPPQLEPGDGNPA